MLTSQKDFVDNVNCKLSRFFAIDIYRYIYLYIYCICICIYTVYICKLSNFQSDLSCYFFFITENKRVYIYSIYIHTYICVYIYINTFLKKINNSLNQIENYLICTILIVWVFVLPLAVTPCSVSPVSPLCLLCLNCLIPCTCPQPLLSRYCLSYTCFPPPPP